MKDGAISTVVKGLVNRIRGAVGLAAYPAINGWTHIAPLATEAPAAPAPAPTEASKAPAVVPAATEAPAAPSASLEAARIANGDPDRAAGVDHARATTETPKQRKARESAERRAAAAERKAGKATK